LEERAKMMTRGIKTRPTDWTRLAPVAIPTIKL
jgi:hypothetical protein